MLLYHIKTEKSIGLEIFLFFNFISNQFSVSYFSIFYLFISGNIANNNIRIIYIEFSEGDINMAFNKVVISGINTSELIVLKEEEKIQLLKEIKETGSKSARDKLINGNLRLVLSVIQRFTGRGEDIDDLFQIGVVGLIKAINNFDLTKNVRFST